MPWVAGALGGQSLATQGLGGGIVYVIALDFGVWIPQVEFVQTFKTPTELSIFVDKRKRKRHRVTRRTGG